MGPACSSYEKILQLIDAGMNVARLNFSHGTHEEHLAVIANLKKARNERKIPLGIMLDLQGPKIRIGNLEDGKLPLVAEQHVTLVKETIIGTQEKISVAPPSIIDSLEKGMTLLLDDGNFTATVIETGKDHAVIQFHNGGILKSHKGINIPGVHLDLPGLTEQDKRDLAFGCQHDVDFIAASFVRTADNLLEIQQQLTLHQKNEILVIAKIETQLAIQEFDAILKVADGIMVARGDLGVELPLKTVPRLQKMMIRRSALEAKPVITATQMLESMIYNPRPTRAEVSDVANAIYDSTSSVMLSGETAVGSYPIETVQMMKSILEETEKDFSYEAFFNQLSSKEDADVSYSVALAAVKTAYAAEAKAIFAITSTGFTARLIASCRPQMPIFALTAHEKVYHQMALMWGVCPVPIFSSTNLEETFRHISTFALQKKLLQPGDLIVLTAGSPLGVRGTTNMMVVKKIS